MNKPSFTPGPWEYVRANPTPTSGAHLIKGSIPGYIAEIREINKTHTKANANLIKAAPKMYAALEACHEAMAYMSEYDIPLTLPEQVKEALAEARGENEPNKPNI